MTDYPEIKDLARAIDQAEHIVIVQADNPDGDSLASALALEQILGDLKKEVSLYCGVDLPSYLSYVPGADRVTKELPNKFDLTIIVDTASESLLEQLKTKGQKSWIAAKPVVIIDHHASEPTIDSANIYC